MYSIDLFPIEIQLLRQSLDVITVSGKDCKFVAALQQKLDHELSEIKKAQEVQSKQKSEELTAIIQHESEKKSGRKI
jgi:hypothetical protein